MYIPKRIPRGSHLHYWIENMARHLDISKQEFLKEAGVNQSTLDQNVRNVFPADRTLWLEITGAYQRLREQNRMPPQQ